MADWDPSFTLPRIALLQPDVGPDQLDNGVEGSSEQLVLDSYGNVVRLWADSHPEIPSGRLEGKFTVTSAARQVMCLVTVQTQIISRRIEGREEPASKATADTRPLPTGTPLSMVPIESVAFPEQSTSATHRLPGGESIRECGRCGASGHLACQPCGQTGRVACSACGGTKLLRCSNCNGVGLVRLANGLIVNCTACLTRGTRSCTSCGPDGNIRCSGCNGEGFNTCSPCGGYGRICSFHVLISDSSTVTQTHVHASDNWDIDIRRIAESMPQIWAEDVSLTLSNNGRPATLDVQQYSPALSPGVVSRLHEAIAAAIARGSVDGLKAETARALRIQIRTCYVHRVGYKLDGGGSEECFYIAGLDNRVAPGPLLDRCRTSTAWAQRGFRGVLRTLGLVREDGLSRTFKKRLKKSGGHVHMLDTETTVAEAVEKAGLKLHVLDVGYELRSEQELVAMIELTHDEAHSSLIVSFVSTITSAMRERFVTALQANKKYVFGRIALTVDAGSGALEFKLVDVRLYNDIDVDTYATLLTYLVNVARPHALSVLKT